MREVKVEFWREAGWFSMKLVQTAEAEGTMVSQLLSPGFWAGELAGHQVREGSSAPHTGQPQHEWRTGKEWPWGGWGLLEPDGRGVSLTPKRREGTCPWSKQGEEIYILEHMPVFLMMASFFSDMRRHLFKNFHLLSNKYGPGTLPETLHTWDHCPQNNHETV